MCVWQYRKDLIIYILTIANFNYYLLLLRIFCAGIIMLFHSSFIDCILLALSRDYSTNIVSYTFTRQISIVHHDFSYLVHLDHRLRLKRTLPVGLTMYFTYFKTKCPKSVNHTHARARAHARTHPPTHTHIHTNTNLYMILEINVRKYFKQFKSIYKCERK